MTQQINMYNYIYNLFIDWVIYFYFFPSSIFTYPNCALKYLFLSIHLFCFLAFNNFIVKLLERGLPAAPEEKRKKTPFSRAVSQNQTPSSLLRHNKKWLMYDSPPRWSFAGERRGVHPGTQIASWSILGKEYINPLCYWGCWCLFSLSRTVWFLF